MGLSDWWTHHRSSHSSATMIASPTRGVDVHCSSKTSLRDDDSAVRDERTGDASCSLWHVPGASKKLKRSKSERMATTHQTKTHPGVRMHGSSHVTTKGLFQQAFAAKFFPKLKRFQLRHPESPLEASLLQKTREEDADASDDGKSRSTSSRLRSLFSRSSGSPQPEAAAEVTTVPAKWLTSDAATAFEAQVQAALVSGAAQFQLTSEGCGGAYFLQAEPQRFKKTVPLGIFKPRDEEYMAPKNPRGYVKEHAVVGETEHPVNKGFRIGNGALRERAAYVLDQAYGGFSGVPVTSVMTLAVNGGGAKEGSMQQFVASECSAEDMGTLKFAIPEVHKIGILDVRLFNTDRHAGNILLAARSDEQTYSMTPIDHGFCLPSYKHLDTATFDWLHWPQAQFPFTGAELDHIASLDVARDASMLRSLGIDEESVTTMRMSTAFLKIGADAGFSLFEIASCLQRDGDFSTPSVFEDLVAAAVAQLSTSDASESAYLDVLVAAVERASAALFAELPKKKVRSISCFS